MTIVALDMLSLIVIFYIYIVGMDKYTINMNIYDNKQDSATKKN